jgi:hypothetical protein
MRCTNLGQKQFSIYKPCLATEQISALVQLKDEEAGELLFLKSVR